MNRTSLLLPSPLDHVQSTLIVGPNFPGSYTILFFTAWGSTFITRHIHCWMLFPLWPCRFLLSGAVSSCPLLFPSSILDSFWTRGLIFGCHIFLPFCTVHGVFRAGILGWFTVSSSSVSHFVRTLHCDLSVLVWPCLAWIISSLSYISLFTMTRQWSMKGFSGNKSNEKGALFLSNMCFLKG